MYLVIVESPTKSKSIAKFLGKDYKVLSSYGHIRDLPRRELGIDVGHNFKPTYVIPSKAKKRVKELKQAAKDTQLVILATDEDREGEAIAWHILHVLEIDKSKKEYQRIVFHEITEEAIKKALENPRQINMNLVNSQQARRLLDRLVGYKLSPFLWKKVMKRLSAGRVQSVAVRLIVDREKERETFKKEEYWTIEAELEQAKGGNNFLAALVKKKDKAISKLGIKTEKQADKIVKELKGTAYKVVNVQAKEVAKHPLPPFITSTLQQEAARKLGFSTKQTMLLAQQLYEGINLGQKGLTGLITYHRTDSLNLATQAIEAARSFIQKQFGEKYLPEAPRTYRTKAKAAQEAHEAIRPTQINLQPENIKKHLDPKQFKLYNLIWQRFTACQMSSARFDATTLEIKAKDYIFKATGQVMKFDGFLKVYPAKIQETILPHLDKGEILKLIRLIKDQHSTQPPARYSEALLVKTLEKYGIGRPSTYAPIISTIQERNYVKKDEQKRFSPTEIGIIVTELLKEHFKNIVDVGFTAEMEQDLDKIAQGKQDWLKVLADFYKPFEKKLKEKYKSVKKQTIEEPTDKKCPECGSNLVIKLGRFGRFYACPKFPACKYTEPLVNSTGVKCPVCKQGELVERRTKKGKVFYSCSRYPQCKFALWNKPTDKKCPQCGSLLTETKNGLKCSNKECLYQEEQ